MYLFTSEVSIMSVTVAEETSSLFAVSSIEKHSRYVFATSIVSGLIFTEFHDIIIRAFENFYKKKIFDIEDGGVGK